MVYRMNRMNSFRKSMEIDVDKNCSNMKDLIFSGVARLCWAALLSNHNDILSSMDDGKVTALTWLKLSAAFDHAILLRRLHGWYRVTGKALD